MNEHVHGQPSAPDAAPAPDAPATAAPDAAAAPDATSRALVITVSNRAAAGVYADTAGPILVDGLRAAGFTVDGPRIVGDGTPVADALREALGQGYDVVLTTGGTGLTPTDRTPEMTSPLLDRAVPGIAEAIRAQGVAQGVPTAMLSRGLAGLAGRTLIVNLPGSPGACRDALGVLTPVLAHAVSQVAGGDHQHVTGDHQHGAGDHQHVAGGHHRAASESA